MKNNIENLLEDVSVLEYGLWENDASKILKGWFAVANNEGIIAYFHKEEDAFMFRLDYINKILNG